MRDAETLKKRQDFRYEVCCQIHAELTCQVKKDVNMI